MCAMCWSQISERVEQLLNSEDNFTSMRDDAFTSCVE